MTDGSYNTFVGYNAGNTENGNVSNNIEIGNTGSSNLAGSNQILIGTTQTGTRIAGIHGTTIATPNSEVCVDANGKLGTANCQGTLSSRLVAAQQDVIKTQQQQIQTLQKQNEEFQQRLSRLESLIANK
jgi:hypothetical protein